MNSVQLPQPVLCLVTGGERGGPAQRIGELVRPVVAAVRGGVNMVQVREKHLHYEDAAMVAQALRTAMAQEGRMGTLVVLNGHPLFAIGDDGRRFVDGIQVPETGFPDVGEADMKEMYTAFRRSGGLVGRSIHSVTAALKAQDEGADFLVLGTVFESRSHPGGPTGGLKLVEDVTTIVDLPVIAIGGITAENAGKVMSAGASGVAVISAILGDQDPEGTARKLRAAMDVVGGQGNRRVR